MNETDTHSETPQGESAQSRRFDVPFSSRAQETLADQEHFLRSYMAGHVAGSAQYMNEKLGALVKRHIFHIPSHAKIGVGWAQLPRLNGSTIALGIFSDDNHFSQVALADWHGRVFLAPPPISDAAGLDVAFTFVPEDTRETDTENENENENADGENRETRDSDTQNAEGISASATADGGDPGQAIPVPAIPLQTGRRVLHALSHVPQLLGRIAQSARKKYDGREGARANQPGNSDSNRSEYETRVEEKRTMPRGMASNPLAPVTHPLGSTDVVRGAMLSGLDAPDDDPRWVASWFQRGRRYDLHEMKMPLPPDYRHNLSYRDAVAIGFFAAGYLPLITGFPHGYGSGAVFRVLREQAPLAALKNVIGIIATTAAAGYRISGLDRFFMSIPDQLGFMDGRAAALLPRHGLEPLELTTSAYSHAFMLHSRVPQNGAIQSSGMMLNMVGEFEALRLESALNRFALISALLESNAMIGEGPVEETADENTVCEMDRRVLRDPVLTSLPIPGSLLWRGQRNAFDEEAFEKITSSNLSVATFIQQAQRFAQATTQHLMEQEKKAGRPHNVVGEWVYRQSLSRLYEMLRLPVRGESDFRSSLQQGHVAVEMSAVEFGLLPDQLFAHGTFVPATDEDKKLLATRESLEQGLLLTALAFGSSPDVKTVTLLITDNRLSDYVHDRQMQPGPGVLDRLILMHHPSTKGEAKDNDRHGDPETTQIVPDGDPFTDDPLSHAMGDEVDDPSVESEGVRQEGMSDDGSTRSDSDEPTSNVEGTNDVVNGSMNDSTVSATDATPAASDNSDKGDSDASDNNGSSDDGDDGDESDDDSDESEMAHAAARAVSGILAAAAPDTQLPDPVRLVTVTFTRDEFEHAIADLATESEKGNETDVMSVYTRCGATLKTDEEGALMPAASPISLRDLDYTPSAAQEEPEAAQRTFDNRARRVLAAKDSLDLSIQREEVLETALDYVKQLQRDENAGNATSVQAAQKATAFFDRIADPELEEARDNLIRALIDRTPVPDTNFEDEESLRSARLELLQSAMDGGDLRKAIDTFETVLTRYDRKYHSGRGVPRFFNSYAERVVYNHLFATPGEKTLIIPDDLFYGHILLADAYGNSSENQAALSHLNTAVSYAPSYAMVHLRQSVQYARTGDWTSARAACLNALTVAVDQLDAGYAYYRLAYAEWQLDRLPSAAACYQTALMLGQNAGGALQDEFEELTNRMRLQGIAIPQSLEEIVEALREDSLVTWPDQRVSTILEEATHVTVDEGMFIPARTIARAWTRVNRRTQQGIDMVQARFLHSLEA